MPDTGYHNKDLTATASRLHNEGAYADMSAVLMVPAFGTVPTKVVASWWNSYFPPNQQVYKLFAVGMEVGEAFSQTIAHILKDPVLGKCKYLLTVEHDNVGPPDGFVKLLQAMHAHPEYAGIGGLYFTKGYGGQPQIWGDPKDPILNYRPQPPDPNGGLVECNGTGMGHNAWRLDMFRDERLRKPWFKTTTGVEGQGIQTQDLYFAGDAKKHGYRFAVHCGVKVGHYDYEGKFGTPDFTW
jgi:hypothetical protein